MERAWTAARHGFRRGDYGWLALAVAIHVLLLLIPAAERAVRDGIEAAQRVSVTLARPARDEPPAAPAVEPLPQPVEISAKRRAFPEARPPKPVVVSPTPPTARELIESLPGIRRIPGEEPERRLGEFVRPPLPRNWQPSLRLEPNRFDDVFLPGETEVIDRWLAADGSHNVVIRTAGGVTLCGRAQPWDPVRPLVEHVMMFRECGGGGRRSFDVPDRYKRSRP